MSATTPREAARPAGRLMDLAPLLAAFAGLFAAGVLSLGHLLELPVPCGGSRGCLAVAAHPSSRVLGVPIAHAGAAAYLILVVLLRHSEVRRARVASVAVSGVGAVVSAGLVVYSQAVIGAACPWCLASALAMAALFALCALGRSRPGEVAFGWVLGLGLVTAAGLGAQAGLMRRAADAPPIPAARLAAVTAHDLVDPAKSLGPPDAPVTIVMFGDLWCPTCRALHAALTEYQRAHARVRLGYRHVPLWRLRGHELSGTAAALGELAAERGEFWRFVDLLYAQPGVVDRAAHLRLMGDLGIPPAQAAARLLDDHDAAVLRVARDLELADELGVTTTPTFVVFARGQAPISASPRTLPRLLNSPLVQRLLGRSEPR